MTRRKSGGAPDALEIDANPLAGLELDAEPFDVDAEWPRDDNVATFQREQLARDGVQGTQSLDWMLGRLCTRHVPGNTRPVLLKFGHDGRRHWLTLGLVPGGRTARAFDATAFFEAHAEDYTASMDRRGRTILTPNRREAP